MKIGSNLTLESKEIGKQTQKFKCKIIDKVENELIVDYPINVITLKQEFHPIGTNFKVTYRAEDNGIYEFSTKINRRVKRTIPGIALIIPKKDKINRIQRREFMRIDATVDVAIHSKYNKFEPFTAITSDISGGGLSIIVPDTSLYKLGQLIEVWIVLRSNVGDLHYVHSNAEIVFIQQRDNIHTLSVKFIDIKVNEQQKIIRFCFEKQREVRKKELS